ncbi:MAG: hypothetical protein P8M70_12000 [Verrucomicrobiota bacterium]|nr:hypothetical protein [Verrucomicrobiota bacterium]
MTRPTFILIIFSVVTFVSQAARAPMMTVPALGKSSAQIEAVHMLNGDVITGKLVKFDPKLGLVWEAANIKPALQINPEAIDRVTFSESTPAQSTQSRVLLTNGNSFSGQLDLADTERVVMSHTLAGQIEFKRSQLKTIIPTAAGIGRVVFSGPSSEKDWVFGSSKNIMGGGGNLLLGRGAPPIQPEKVAGGKFEFKAGTITSTSAGATAGRKVEFPDKALIEFEVDWSSPGRNSSYFSLNVNLFTDNLKSPSSGSSYALKLSQTGANLTRQSKRNGDFISDRLGSNIRVNLTGIGSRVRYSLRTNKKSRSFILSINGVQIANWKDKEAFAGKGDGLLFTSRAPAPLKVSNIRISQWDGSKPIAATDTTISPKQDTIRLVNDDTVTGAITGIRDGKVKIKSSFGEVAIPWTNSRLIQFAKSSQGTGINNMEKDMVQAALKGGGILDFKLTGWTEDKLEVESPIFGKATLDGAMIDSVTFNAGDKRNKRGKTLTKKELKKLQREK